jgi:hypothetical protein
MAKADKITVEVEVAIPDETICRCLRLLEMWMDDNPQKRVLVDKILFTEGYHHKIRIEDWEVEHGDSDT